jgi:choline dehydrogenase-like flavoprotein
MFDMLDRDLIVDRIERFSEPTDFGRYYRDWMKRSDYAVVALNAPVTRIRAAPDGRAVKSVVVARPDGGEWEIAASRVVIAAGALETVRTLLSSSQEKACGLGNERGLVGRFYGGHLEGHMGELVLNRSAAARMDYFRDVEGIYCRRYMWLSPDAQRREHLAGLVLRPTHAKVPDPAHRNPVLSAMSLVKTLMIPEYARGLTSTEQQEARRLGGNASIELRHVMNMVRGSPRLIAFAADWTRRRWLARRKLPSVFLIDRQGRYPVDVNAEQRPNRESRVSIGTPRDANGQRRLVIDWRPLDEDRASVVRGVALADEALQRAGVGRIVLPDPERAAAALTRVGGHHVGTARMADTPDDGVVDGNGELFDVRGLYVLGAAAFPTSGFANPTLTIVALAMRMGEHLALRIADHFT